MKEIHAPVLAQIVPIVLGCLDAGRAQFGIASVAGAHISADQAEMHIHLSSERDVHGACKFAKRCVREVVGVLKKSKLLRSVPYVSFRPAPQDQTVVINQLLVQAGQELARAQAAGVASVVPLPAKAAAAPVAESKKAPAPKTAPKKPLPKKAAAKKSAAKVPAKKPVAKKTAPVKKPVVKAPAQKPAAKKTPAKKVAPAKKPAKKTAVKKPAAKAAKKSRR